MRICVCLSFPANTPPSEQSSSTTPSDRTPNTAVSYTAPCPSCAKKALQASTEVYSPSYVCLPWSLLSPGSMDVVLDDAARRQLGGAVHDLYHAQAVCAVHCASGSTASERDHVWDWCDCGPRDGLCHATTRVRLGNFVFARASDVWGSVIKTRMQALNAPQEYKNSFHCGYRILTEEGLLRFWTGTTPRLTRLVVSNTFNVHPYKQ